MSEQEGCTLYILLCRDGSYYTGTTRKELDERLSEHQNGHFPDCYTFRRRPLRCVFSAHFQMITDAIAAERQIKGWSRSKKEALIAGRFEHLPWLASRPTARRGPAP